MNQCIKFEENSDENLIGNMISSETSTLIPGHIFLSKNSDKTPKNVENHKIYQLNIDSDENLIGNMISSETSTLIPSHIFLSKNSDKTPKNVENHKIYQLVNTHILMCVIH